MKNLILVVIGCAFLWACSQPKPEPEAAPVETKPQPLEVGDSRYIDIAKQGLQNLREGNIDGFTSSLADNAHFDWNYLDSLVGKQAISEYWKDRRTRVIDTLITTNEVWITLKANDPPAPGLPTGTYVFAWYKATAKYTATGKSMTQWIHQINHFDANDKIDYISQYLDRVPIQQATKK